jgi:diaminopimelate epimerase
MLCNLRKEMIMRYLKYHALGNDYLVMAPGALENEPTPEKIQRICHRNYGIGSDGILVGPFESNGCDYRLRIFNPDGSEAEKSGNGLRIFARALWDQQMVSNQPFTIETSGGNVTCTVAPGGRSVTVEMGKVGFHSAEIPVAGAPREVLNEEIAVAGRRFTFCAATVGNPHCVILSENPSPEETRQYGPLIETDARFPNRTNVQFMQVIDPENIRIEIWERGAGYTLASGSSSTAAAAVAKKLGLCGSRIRVHMPGGELDLTISDDYQTVMTGPVTKVCEGVIADEMFEPLAR